MKYREYFDIDPDYFPQATEELINRGKVDWKKYYPHETFVKLVKDTIAVLTRQQKLSLWVEGAYGTGKSHAVLTLQKLLEESEEETKAYFDKYSSFLSNDLYNKLQGIKKQGKIVIARRYGSSSVNGDNDLIFCIQESIISALRKNNIEDIGSGAMRESIMEWLSIDSNKIFFNSVIKKEEYQNLFSGENADTIRSKLETYSEISLLQLMTKIYKIADELPRSVFKIDMDKLIIWIEEVIAKNNIKAIFFVWDEFTNYFENNLKHLTEFQKLVEMSATNPFYMCIVTHKSDGLFSDTDNDRKRILDRFVKPTCKIELPENMAFQLMAQAMEKNKDPDIFRAWQECSEDLNSRMNDCRMRVKESAKITERELINIMPIHPYSALILKHISSAFNSNQRSMFEFIKNDRGEEIKGFQWFIDNFGPEDDEALLTIDLLWDFFYEKGKDYLAPNIRTILDSYNRQNIKLLTEEERKVLKTVLLMQSISQKVGDRVEVFIPNEININYAYEGTELEGGMAANLANKLCRDEVLYKKPMGTGKFQYSAMTNAGDTASIEKRKEEIKKEKKTSKFIEEGEMSDMLNLSGALSLRYAVEVTSTDDFTRKINELRSKENKYANRLMTVITFAKNEEEGAALNKQIRDAVKNEAYQIIFIDTSITPLGADAIDLYSENMANHEYYLKKDNGLANQYAQMAKEILKKWKSKILNSEFLLYSNNRKEGLRLSNIEELYIELAAINKNIYPNGIEQFNVIDTMFAANSLKSGAECGVTEKTAFTFKSGNNNTKLETALEGAWETKEYWKNPDSTFKNPCIKKIKIYVDEIIKDGFKKEGQISILKIYESLTGDTYGFMPCNLTAFVLGFLLKEYTNDTYRWNNGQTSEPMSVTKMKEMIDEVIKLQITPNPKYKDNYIVTLTKEEKMFSEVTSQIFNIPINQCVSIPQTRDRIRTEMKKLLFPFWCLKYITNEINISTDINLINQIIDEYSGIANTNNIGGRRSEQDIALSIGKIYIENNSIVQDLLLIVNKENCRKGMSSYTSKYNEGNLIVKAKEIGVENKCLVDLKEKFDADAANWVWNIDTANQKIDELILEYEIIRESNKFTSKSNSFDEMLQAWCDKLSFLKLSYEAIKNSCDDIKPLLEILVSIKKTGTLQEIQKKSFLNLLNLKQNELREFFANQFEIFKNVCNFELFGLTEEEKNEVFQQLNLGMVTKDKAEFTTVVSSTVNEYKNSQENRKLKDFWKAKTGSNSPREWSSIHKTPILCMVPLKEIAEARVAFSAVNKTKPEKTDIHRAMTYFEKASFFDFINNEDKQNEMFVKHVIKNYSIMLSNPFEVRDFLTERLGAEVYDWYGSPEVENLLRQFAEKKYDAEGNIKALQIIEEMDEATVKSYLKRLIKENITVGMEIIKNNSGG